MKKRKVLQVALLAIIAVLLIWFIVIMVSTAVQDYQCFMSCRKEYQTPRDLTLYKYRYGECFCFDYSNLVTVMPK